MFIMFRWLVRLVFRPLVARVNAKERIRQAAQKAAKDEADREWEEQFVLYRKRLAATKSPIMRHILMMDWANYSAASAMVGTYPGTY